MKLEQIESDVVVVMTNSDAGRVRVAPQWECETPKDELEQLAARLAYQFAEDCGGGFVDAVIFDYRE